MVRSRVLLAAALIAAVPALPSGAYPAAGNDSFDSSATVFFTPVPGCQPDLLTQSVVLAGPTTVVRGTPSTDLTGREYFETEIVQLDLTGSGPIGDVVVREDPDRPSTGKVTQQEKGKDFPADSFFDVFVEIKMGGATFTNLEAVHMQAVIHSLPPHAVDYLPPPGTCIPLALKGTPVPVLWMTHAEHTPLSSRDCFLSQGAMRILDTKSWLTYQAASVGPGHAELVHGKARQAGDPIPIELISLSLTGMASDDRGGQTSFGLSEPPRTGSFGTLKGSGPTLDSFFDVFVEVSIGPDTFPIEDLPMQGSYDPSQGGMLSFGGGHADPSGRWVVQEAHFGVGPTGACGNYPPA